MRQRVRHQTYAQGRRGYRPTHAWLGSPGDGVPIRARRTGGRWAFRWTQLRILLLALILSLSVWLALPAATH